MFTPTRLTSAPLSGVASVEPNGLRCLREKRLTVILGAGELAKFALTLHPAYVLFVPLIFSLFVHVY